MFFVDYKVITFYIFTYLSISSYTHVQLRAAQNYHSAVAMASSISCTSCLLCNSYLTLLNFYSTHNNSSDFQLNNVLYSRAKLDGHKIKISQYIYLSGTKDWLADCSCCSSLWWWILIILFDSIKRSLYWRPHTPTRCFDEFHKSLGFLLFLSLIGVSPRLIAQDKINNFLMLWSTNVAWVPSLISRDCGKI